MNTNYNFNDYDEIAPVKINEAHMAVQILCDISGSMAGSAIKNLNLSVNRFSEDICRDPDAAKCVDVSVVGFNQEASIAMNWRPISEMGKVEFAAGGGTNLANALELSVDMLRERCHLYEKLGVTVKVPYLILVTDGYGGDVSEIARVIRKRSDEKKLRLWVLAAPGYDKQTVAELTDGKRVFEMKDGIGFDCSEFFDFLAVSTIAASVSAPGERISVNHRIGSAESSCRVPDLNDWLND